jgi:hypothetical protein
MDIKTDLSEIEEDVYNFDTIFGSYRLELKKNSAKIHKKQSFSSENISLLRSTNFFKK